MYKLYVSAVGDQHLSATMAKEAQMLEESEYLVSEIEQLNSFLASVVPQSLDAGQKVSENLSANDAIEALRSGSEIISQLKSSLEDLLPNDNLINKQTEGALEITSIQHISEETYEITINNHVGTPIDSLTIQAKIGNIEIPLSSIDHLPEYAKLVKIVHIPINLLFANSRIYIQLIAKNIETVGKELTIVDILEAIQNGNNMQLKIKNNTGFYITACICDVENGELKAIVMKPSSLEFHEVEVPSGSFFITRNNETISNIVEN